MPKRMPPMIAFGPIQKIFGATPRRIAAKVPMQAAAMPSRMPKAARVRPVVQRSRAALVKQICARSIRPPNSRPNRQAMPSTSDTSKRQAVNSAASASTARPRRACRRARRARLSASGRALAVAPTFSARAQERQQADLHADPGAADGGEHEGPGVQGKHRDTGEERRQVAAHRQARAEAGDDTADQAPQAAFAGRPAQADVAGPEGAAQGAEEHADDHHSVDPVQRRALKADQPEVAPVLWLVAEPGQHVAASELAGHRPEGAGEREVVGGGDAEGDQRRQRRPEPHQVALAKRIEGEHATSLNR